MPGFSAKPSRLPNAILNNPSAAPPEVKVQVDSTLPAAIHSSTRENTCFTLLKSGSPSAVYRGWIQYTGCPAPLNSVPTTLPACAVDTANETSVGGTSICSKVPDMESLPPIAPIPSCSCASNAPSSAANGLPQRLGSSFNRSKYSWKVSQQCPALPPAATTLATDSTTANIAP